ncbi:MAG: hypothetical protein P8N92_00010 [Burkholderiales bacterium]|nr:hypothetical protein [Burkholderiales bacterium]
MRALFVFPPGRVSREIVQRAELCLKYKLGDIPINFGCFAGALNGHRDVFRDDNFVNLNRDDLSSFEAVAFLKDEEGQIADSTQVRVNFKTRRIYWADGDGILRYGQSPLDLIENPHRDAHIFNRLMGQSDGERFSIFPGGYLYRILNLGPTNEHGLRITDDIEALASRNSNHKVVAIFGGSGAWSTLSLYDEMFTQLLQHELNYYAKSQNLSLKITVLNFAQPHGLILNEINTFLLWGYKCRPDLVISHSGVNDFSSGQVSDTNLLNRDKITYQFYYESWAKILAENPNIVLMSERAGQMASTNLPRAIIGAFIERLRQFEIVVRAYKADFLHVLQPFALSKQALSDYEMKRLGKVALDSPYMVLTQNLPFLYEKFLSVRSDRLVHPVLDLHSEFYRLGSESTLFGDYIHTLPAGDKLIARMYFEYLKDQLFPRWIAECEGG